MDSSKKWMNIKACEEGSGGAVPITDHYEAKIAICAADV